MKMITHNYVVFDLEIVFLLTILDGFLKKIFYLVGDKAKFLSIGAGTYMITGILYKDTEFSHTITEGKFGGFASI